MISKLVNNSERPDPLITCLPLPRQYADILSVVTLLEYVLQVGWDSLVCSLGPRQLRGKNFGKDGGK